MEDVSRVDFWFNLDVFPYRWDIRGRGAGNLDSFFRGDFFNDTNATPGTTYYYWVKASNTYGTSEFSAYDAGYR